MKKTISLFLLFFLLGCGGELRIAKLQFELSAKQFSSVAIMRLPPSSFITNHNIAQLRNKDFSIAAQQALESAIAKKRKAWNLVYSANISATEPFLADSMTAIKERAVDVVDTSTLRMMKNAISILGSRYMLVLESISVKDGSSAQAPAMAIFGAWLQVWDMSNGTLIYRARNVSRPVSYAEKDFDQRLTTALYDLFAETLRPLPKL
jgi:hypothetical protein